MRKHLREYIEEISKPVPKIKWKKATAGYIRKPGGGSTEVFKWISPNERFVIGRATDPSAYGKGRGNAHKLVWKISDKSDNLKKAYLTSYDTAASAKRAAEIIISREST